MDEDCASESRCSVDSKQRTAAPADSLHVDGGAVPTSFCLIINNQTVHIRSVSIKITGLEVKNQTTPAKKEASVEISLNAATGDVEYPTPNPPEASKIKKIIKMPKFFKKSKSPRREPSTKSEKAAAAATGSSVDGRSLMVQQDSELADNSSAVKKPSGAPSADYPECNSDHGSCISEISVPPGDEGKARVANALAAAAAAAAAATAYATSNASATAAATSEATATTVESASNTVESETAGEKTPAPVCPEKLKPKPKSLSSFLNRKKDTSKGSRDELSSFNFPQDLPDSVKALFGITSDTHLIATVYASKANVKNQKRLLIEGSKKRFTVDGKQRSVWLDPSPGELVEIWKEYIEYTGNEGTCNRALGRLPGTEKYGYIVPDEVDYEREFDTPEERQEYKYMLEKLSMFQDVYGNDDDEHYA